MSWEWSHTPEAYQNVEEQIHAQPKEWLVVCWSEIQAAVPDGFVGAGEPDFDEIAYQDAEEVAPTLPSDMLADAIWEFAQKHRLCTNGGFEAHCCPFGCHTVPFEPVAQAAE